MVILELMSGQRGQDRRDRVDPMVVERVATKFETEVQPEANLTPLNGLCPQLMKLSPAALLTQ